MTRRPAFFLGVDPDEVSVADDALYSQSNTNLTLSGLDPAKSYNFDLFGTRDATGTRVTLYTLTGANSDSGTLTTSGTGIGTGGVNYNNDTILTLAGLIPNGSGEISLNFAVNSGSCAYLSGMQVSEVPGPAHAEFA